MPKGPTGGTTAPQRQELFAPFGQVLRTLAGTGADSVRYEVDSARRVQISRLAMTVFGMWDVIVGAEGYDLSRSAPSEPSVSLYDDGMLSYQLTNTIWSWNRLEQRRHHDHDDLDVEIARSLVRFLDVAIGIKYYSDARKRCEEAIANLLAVFPDLYDVMCDEASGRAFGDGLIGSLEETRRWSDGVAGRC
ncbi:MAG: hypothetical protein KAY11_03235 [Ilumatobacteraceae bacterium]|jgi:hypothetical protein|nr:hypothetical protein [Acidimicrobiaceae bacterium]MBP6486111.1 hypothetical protein [Ilumatobacteraceae bacterium]MBP8208554.1 hypothetical protein [Ilumatobacteraceae bacterium]